MKRTLYLALALMMLMSIFAVPSSAQEQTVVRIGGMVPGNSLDNQYWTAQLRINEGALMEGLFGYDSDGITIIPKVAESWEVSEDGLTWTFKLREDKKWSNGEQLTAQHFYDAWVDYTLDTQSPLWASFLGFANGYTARGSSDPDLLFVELVDDFTLKIWTQTPSPGLYAWLCMAQSFANYTPIVEEYGADWWRLENWVGNGPYVPVEFTPDEFFAMEKNPEYVGDPDDGYGNVDRFEFYQLPPGTSALPSFESDELDVITIGGLADITYVKNNPDLAPAFLEFPSFDWTGYETSMTHGGLMDVKEFRQAFYQALDRDYLCLDVMGGLWDPAHTYGWAAEPRIVDNVEGLPYDPDVAREKMAMALEKMGYESTADLPIIHFYTPPSNAGEMPVYEEMARMWQEELGVEVLIEPQDWSLITTYSWTGPNSALEDGFIAPIGGAMNQFDPRYLNNQSAQTVWNVGWPGFIQEFRTEQTEFNNELATVDKVPTQEEWDAQMEETVALFETDYTAIKEEMGWDCTVTIERAGTPWEERIANLEEQWAEAETDEEKTNAWTNLLRYWMDTRGANIRNEWVTTTEPGKEHGYAQNLQHCVEMMDYTDEAFAIAAELHQTLIEIAHMSPIGITKRFFMAKENISGVVPRYLSWSGLQHFQYYVVE